MSGGGSGGGSGGIGGSAKGIAKGFGNVVEGVAKTAKKAVQTAVSIPASLLAPKQEVADYSDYYTSTGDNAADNSISYTTQSAQSTGADQYSEGEAGNSVSSTSILSGNNPGAVMLGKKALLGRK